MTGFGDGDSGPIAEGNVSFLLRLVFETVSRKLGFEQFDFRKMDGTHGSALRRTANPWVFRMNPVENKP